MWSVLSPRAERIAIIWLRVVLDEFFEDFANQFDRELGDIETSLWGWQPVTIDGGWL
jgi:hypothetical protein